MQWLRATLSPGFDVPVKAALLTRNTSIAHGAYSTYLKFNDLWQIWLEINPLGEEFSNCFAEMREEYFTAADSL